MRRRVSVHMQPPPPPVTLAKNKVPTLVQIRTNWEETQDSNVQPERGKEEVLSACLQQEDGTGESRGEKYT